MKIAIDFDGTIVEQFFPEIGPEVPSAVETILEWQKEHEIILWTCRSEELLDTALLWCENKGIVFSSVNDSDQRWPKNRRKLYADLYIDDNALGCPLIYVPSRRPFVNWKRIKELFDNLKLVG